MYPMRFAFTDTNAQHENVGNYAGEGLPSPPTTSHSLTSDLVVGSGLLLCFAVKPETDLYRMYPDTQINTANVLRASSAFNPPLLV